jgi:hypothetical protein
LKRTSIKPRWGKPPDAPRGERAGGAIKRQDTLVATLQRGNRAKKAGVVCACALTDGDAKHDVRVLVEYRSCIYHIWQVSRDRLRHGTGSPNRLGYQRKTKRLPCPPTHGLAV